MITARNKPGLFPLALTTLLAIAVLFSSCSVGCVPSPSDNRSTSAKPSSQVSPLPASTLEIISFQAQPKRIKLGETTTLSWEIAGASSFAITPDIGKTAGNTGSMVISPGGTTLYTLKAMDGNNETTARFLVITESKEGSILWPSSKTDNATVPLPPEGWIFYPNENVNWVISETYKPQYTEDSDFCFQIGNIANNSNNWTMTDVMMGTNKIAVAILPGQKHIYTTSVICKDFTLKWKWQLAR
jgi:hypothetical protein